MIYKENKHLTKIKKPTSSRAGVEALLQYVGCYCIYSFSTTLEPKVCFLSTVSGCIFRPKIGCQHLESESTFTDV